MAEDHKKMLAEYHSQMLRVLGDWQSGKLGGPEQNFAATNATVQFTKVVQDFESEHGAELNNVSAPA